MPGLFPPRPDNCASIRVQLARIRFASEREGDQGKKSRHAETKVNEPWKQTKPLMRS